MRKNEKEKHEKILSNITLYSYHKRLAVLNLVMGLIWTFYWLTRDNILAIDDNDSLFTIKTLAVLCVLFVIVMIEVIILLNSAKNKDVEDELYKQNVALANEKLGTVVGIGFCVLMLFSVIYETIAKFTGIPFLQFNYALCVAIYNLYLATQHFLILHFEKTSSASLYELDGDD